MLPKAELLAEEEEDSLIENANCLSNLYARRKLAGFNLHKRQHIPENEYSGHREGWKCIYELIFESSTSEGQWFDVALLILISLSVAAAVLDSVNAIQDEYGNELLAIEIVFTFLFSVECLMRVLCIKHPKEYIFSLMGIVDATSILPTYLAAVIPSARPLIHLAVLRVLRVLRVFRVLKLVRFMDEASALAQSMHDNRRRIAVFLFTVFALILVIGCTMYLIEGERNGFSSIPISLYWTVVTLTTVGYGDIAPQSVFGRVIATFVMLAGYGIIACPVVLAVPHALQGNWKQVTCSKCFEEKHAHRANYCAICGTLLYDQAES